MDISCAGPGPSELAADLEGLAELEERRPTPETLGPGWDYTVFDRAAVCLPLSRDGCTVPTEYDATIDSEHRVAVDFNAPGITVFSMTINAELFAERYTDAIAQELEACPLDVPKPYTAPGLPDDAETILTLFDEPGQLGAVSTCRTYRIEWNGGTNVGEHFACHAADGETRIWLQATTDPANPMSRADIAEAMQAAAAAAFAP